MDTTPVRSAVDDAMHRLLEAVAETRKHNARALQQTRRDAASLRAAPPNRARTSRVRTQRAQ
jgi:hypothetical protein